MNPIRAIGNSAVFLELVRLRVLVILLATVIIASATVPGFLDAQTVGLSLDRMSTMGLIALGLTVLLIAGQLDLSGGAVLALAGIVTISLQPALGPGAAALAGVLTGVLVGLLNGFLVVVLRINSLVATLASMLMVRAICHWVTNSHPISGEDPFFGLFVTADLVGPLSFRTVLFGVGILLLWVWLSRTVSGRNLYAVGSNPVSATASGVPSSRYLFGGFVFASMTAAVAGTVQSLAVNTGSPAFGQSIVMTTIAAVVIGGTRLEGGRGSALGTLGGLLTIAFLVTAMEYQNVPAYVQDIVTGAILLLLIILDTAVSGKQHTLLTLAALKGRLGGSRTQPEGITQ